MAVLKMFVQSLVLSHLRYTVPVWGPYLSHNLQSRLEKMFKCAASVVKELRKFDHASGFRRKLEMAFCLVTDPALLSANVVSTLLC